VNPPGSTRLEPGCDAAPRDLRAAQHDLTAEPPLFEDVLGLDIDPSLQPVVDAAVPLTEYAWRFRYPGEEIPPTHAEVARALSLASQALDEIFARIPSEAYP